MEEIKVELYGRLTEIAGNNILHLKGIKDTRALEEKIHSLYPEMTKQKYLLAVNNEVVKTNTVLNAESKVALMPPFSGG